MLFAIYPAFCTTEHHISKRSRYNPIVVTPFLQQDLFRNRLLIIATKVGY